MKNILIHQRRRHRQQHHHLDDHHHHHQLLELLSSLKKKLQNFPVIQMYDTYIHFLVLIHLQYHHQ
jgi:hypothetical protein